MINVPSVGRVRQERSARCARIKQWIPSSGTVVAWFFCPFKMEFRQLTLLTSINEVNLCELKHLTKLLF